MTSLKIVEVNIVSTGKAIVYCSFCKGGGGVPPNYSRENQKPCSVCGGQGKALVEFEEETFVECAYCKGGGGVPPNYSRENQKPCPTCSGLGIKPIAGNWKIIK